MTKVKTKSKASTLDKPPKAIVHRSTGDDENRRKKLKKKTSATDRVLSSRNDVVTRTELSQPAKRKSEQMITKHAAGDEDDSGCPQPKKPSPTQSVSVEFVLSNCFVGLGPTSRSVDNI